MYGLTFNEKHSFNDYGLIMRSVDRSLLPAVRKQTAVVFPIDGSFDMQSEPIYEDRVISVNLSFTFKGLEQLRQKQRQVAQWLSGRSRLIFDDEPDKYYDAKVCTAVAINNEGSVVTFSVGFECKPFAFGINYEQKLEQYNDNPRSMSLDVDGRDAPCIITCKNIGNTDIHNIKITRQIRV